MRKILYVVLDGLGDRPCPELEGRTPLEAAPTPNMDRLAKDGINGFVYTVGKGIAPESDIAVISILGYDAHKYYTGRGPLESYAEGLEVPDGCLAYRVNFATCGEGDSIVDRRVGRNLTTEEATALAKEINQKVKLTSYRTRFIFKNTIGHRGILIFYPEEGKLSANVSNTDPAYAREGVFGVALEKFEPILQKCVALDDTDEARRAADLTNEFIAKSTEVLNESRVNQKRVSEGKLAGNLILTRDGGDSLPHMPPITKEHGVKFGCFVEMPVERGIAILTDMEVVDVPLATGDAAEDYPLRAERAIKELENYDGLYIHLKGPDEPAHDGRAQDKLTSIEEIDKFFFQSLLPKVDLANTIITVTADHSTPCALKAHSDDPVPILICGGAIPADSVSDFSEKSCRTGSIGELLGMDIMSLLIKYAS